MHSPLLAAVRGTPFEGGRIPAVWTEFDAGLGELRARGKIGTFTAPVNPIGARTPDPFLSGEVAMVLDGGWLVQRLVRAPELTWRPAAVPTAGLGPAALIQYRDPELMVLHEILSTATLSGNPPLPGWLDYLDRIKRAFDSIWAEGALPDRALAAIRDGDSHHRIAAADLGGATGPLGLTGTRM
ncbi:hypothetical protein H5T55_01265 [Candidatus Bipolaricaulota bacterium]|nr:hypothetical protein [Candidatus Bipolaricaulota bacterium]